MFPGGMSWPPKDYSIIRTLRGALSSSILGATKMGLKACETGSASWHRLPNIFLSKRTMC